MPYGLLTTGFAPKPLSVIKDELEAAFRAAFGASIDVSPQSVFGQIIGIMSEQYAELWEAGAAADAAYKPDSATGAALDAVASITATVRAPASPSTVTGTMTGVPTTVLSTGRQASVTATGIKFITTAPGTITVLTSWATSTAYVVGDRRTANSRCFICSVAGTSAAAGPGPNSTGTGIVDGVGALRWDYLGEGTGAIDIAMESVDDGPFVAAARTLTVIETPVAGWQSVINLLDAVVGTNEEDDPTFRLRREEELAGEGASTLRAIRAAVLRVAGVSQAVVFQNTTLVTTTDTPGIPGKAVEVVVQGGANQDLWDAIFRNVAAGIEAFGGTVGSSVDDNGDSQVVAFSRPSDLDVYIIVELIKDPSVYPPDGDAQVEQAIVDAVDLYRFGKDLAASAVVSYCFQIAGVLDVTSVKLGTAPNPTLSATIVADPRDQIVADTSRITIITSDGVP